MKITFDESGEVGEGGRVSVGCEDIVGKSNEELFSPDFFRHLELSPEGSFASDQAQLEYVPFALFS